MPPRGHKYISSYPHIVVYHCRLALGVALHHHWRVEVIDTVVAIEYIAVGGHHHIVADNGIGRDVTIRPDAAVVADNNPCSQSEKGLSLYVNIFAGRFENAAAHRSPQPTEEATHKMGGGTTCW